MKSTKLLMADHELILQGLAVLDSICKDVRGGQEVIEDDIRSLLTFLREFADGCHHVKEEAIFFPALIQAGMRPNTGVMKQMNDEHERGRALTAAMQNAVERRKMDDFGLYAGRYIELLREHILKEDTVLFDKADLILSDEEDAAIAAGFEQFDTKARWRHTIHALALRYLAFVCC
jgi:hemerythrin-like domain-containing protein